MGLLVQRHKLVNQEMITGVKLTPEQEMELALLNEKLEKTAADKQRLEAKVASKTATPNDQKKLIGIFKMLFGNV